MIFMYRPFGYQSIGVQQSWFAETYNWFQDEFYPRKWAHYELAVPKTLKLLPPEYRLEALRKDYASMENMMFGDYPDFDSLMQFIGELEREINSLPAK